MRPGRNPSASLPAKPISEQIDDAFHRATETARTLTSYPDRITPLPVPPRDDDLIEER